MSRTLASTPRSYLELGHLRGGGSCSLANRLAGGYYVSDRYSSTDDVGNDPSYVRDDGREMLRYRGR
jgi:hypothetical protein